MMTHFERKYLSARAILESIDDPRRDAVLAFHDEFEPLMRKAKGSAHNHQAWEGGYLDHIAECLRIACHMYMGCLRHRDVPFTFPSAVLVLYFHDIEKIWKYTDGSDIDKDDWYNNILPSRGIQFTAEEMNALEYAHGEVDDHSKTERKMNELAAFCHCCDVMSARIWWDKGRD